MEKVGVPSKQSVKGRAACLLELGLAQSSIDPPPSHCSLVQSLQMQQPRQGRTARGWTQDSRRRDASGGPWGLMKTAWEQLAGSESRQASGLSWGEKSCRFRHHGLAPPVLPSFPAPPCSAGLHGTAADAHSALDVLGDVGLAPPSF